MSVVVDASLVLPGTVLSALAPKDTAEENVRRPSGDGTADTGGSEGGSVSGSTQKGKKNENEEQADPGNPPGVA